MKIQLLHIDECPNWKDTEAHLRTALDSVGAPEETIDVILVSTAEEAAKYPFAGSPTILIDGEDPFPNGGPITELACRIYQTDTGLAGGPTIEQLTQILRKHF